MPSIIFFIGRNSPIIPVEHTKISDDENCKSEATCSALLWVSWNPRGPVHALAPPEFMTTARTEDPFITSLLQITGAAIT